MNLLPRLLWAWMLTVLLACHAHAQGQFKPVPPQRARVTDEIGMLTPDQRERLEAVLADYERNKGSQIAVLIVSSTEPEAIEQYGIRVVDAWKLGRKGIDDGVLLLVAKDNPKALRRLRIEAGRGVQGVLTDAQSKRILEDTIAPHFRQQDWYGGLAAGVGAIAAVLNQEKFPETQQQAPAQQDDDGGPGIIVTIFMLVAGFAMLRSFFRRGRTRLAQPGRRGPNDPNWGHSWGSGTTGVILGSALGSAASDDDDDRRRGGGFSDGFSDSGGFSGGGGGTFDGGGASGDW